MPEGFDDTVPDPVVDFVTVRTYTGTKFAVAVRAVLIVTVHVAVVPEQLPDQPVNLDPAEAAAVRVTFVLELKYAVQSTPQLIPPMFEVTVPEPVPERAAVSRYCAVKVAVTERAAVIARTHEPVPVHEPDQPENTYPVAAPADRVTVVPVANGAEHTVPQAMPGTFEVTVPVPDFVTLAVNAGANDAVAPRACDIVSVHVVDVPLQEPDHPVNTDPEAAAAVIVTCVPDTNDAEQSVPHEMPPTLEVTVPVPEPDRVMLRR